MVDDTAAALSNQFFSKTSRNLAENPVAELLMIDPTTYDEYRLAISYERTSARGPSSRRCGPTSTPSLPSRDDRRVPPPGRPMSPVEHVEQVPHLGGDRRPGTRGGDALTGALTGLGARTTAAGRGDGLLNCRSDRHLVSTVVRALADGVRTEYLAAGPARRGRRPPSARSRATASRRRASAPRWSWGRAPSRHGGRPVYLIRTATSSTWPLLQGGGGPTRRPATSS